MYFDTHAHYDDKAFDEDRDELVSALKDNGVELVMAPGCDIKSSRYFVALSEKHDFVYSSVGIHPEELSDDTEENLREIAELANNDKCCAIGEIGLDYYWDDTHKEQQKKLFIRQIEIALELGKPIIVHDREAHGDSMDIVRRYTELKGVFHCFSGSAEMAQELLKRGWYLGFDGPVTYKNARKVLEVLEICPLDRILVETDSPYMSPVPNRGKRNDSRNLKYIVEKIAEIKGESAELIAAIALENGKRLFGIN